MSEVPVSIIRAAVAVSERHGIPRGALLGRPSVSEAELARGGRVGWEAFCEFNARVEAAWAGRGGLERFARAANAEVPELRAVARPLLAPAQLLRLAFAVGTWAHPAVETSSRTLRDGRLELVLRLPQTRRDDPSFLRICGHSLAHAPCLVGLPPAALEMEVVPHRATYRFTLPPSRTVFARAQDAAGELTRLTLERIEQLQAEVRALRREVQQEGRDVDARARELGRRWHLTPRQVEVLAQLARGLTNREIAAVLGCAERTVEIHVTALLAKAGLKSRARLVAGFWTLAS